MIHKQRAGKGLQCFSENNPFQSGRACTAWTA